MTCNPRNPIVRFLVSIFPPPVPSASPDPSATTTTNNLGNDCVGDDGISLCTGFD